MSTITPIQNSAINPPINNKQVKSDPNTVDVKNEELLVINKMSQQLNAKGLIDSDKNITEKNSQDFLPDANISMMGAQSGNITAEFVANLLNKSPYNS